MEGKKELNECTNKQKSTNKKRNVVKSNLPYI